MTPGYEPSYDDEEIQPVPCVGQVSTTSKESHCGYFYAHLGCEEGKDHMIEGLEHVTSGSLAVHIGTRLVHSQRQTID